MRCLIDTGKGEEDKDITPDQRLLNAEADALAGWGRDLNRPPPQAIILGAKLRVQIAQLLQAFLVSVRIARQKLEEAQIAVLLAAKREIMPLPV